MRKLNLALVILSMTLLCWTQNSAAKEGVEIVLQTGHTANVYSVAFSPDGRYIVSGSWDETVRLWETETGKQIRIFQGHTFYVNSVAFSPDGRYIVSGGLDGSIRVWNPDTGNLLLTAVSFRDGEWVAYTPQNYFTSSQNGGRYIAFRIGNKSYEFEQYAELYHQPEIVAKIVKGEDISILVAEIEKKTGVEVSKVNIADIPPPEVVIQYLEYDNTVLKPETQRVDCSPIIIVAQVVERKNGVDKVIIELNGKTVFEEATLGKKEYQIKAPITLKEKDNQLTILAYSTKRVKSYPQEISITYEGQKTPIEIVKYYYRHGWAVVIGIDKYQKFSKLSYSVKDAQAITSLLIDNFGFSKDKVITIPEGEATRQRIERLLGDELPGTITEKDRLLVFFSGHGRTKETQGGKKIGYLIPIDGDPNIMDSTCIPMDQISRYSELIPAKHILFIIDSCYSGLAGIVRKEGLSEETKDQIRKLVERPGRQIMTAGGKDEPVVQGEKWKGYSIFTYYLLKGLKGEADSNSDKVITIHELTAYLENKVTKDAEQTPQLRYLGEGEGQFIFYKEK